MKDRGPSKLTVDCDICGEPMTIDRHRYLALIRAGQRPRCRRNGCERLCGAKTPGTARSGQPLAVIGVPPLLVVWPGSKKGRTNGALAKLAVRRLGIEGMV